MKYKELKSLYYEDNQKYSQEYFNRFHSEESIKIDFFIGENQAFFLQNTQVMTLAYRIARLDKEVEKLCSGLPGIALSQYSKKCLIDEIVLTNKIEGVHSSRKEIGEVLDTLETQSKSKGKHVRFIGLVNKYLKLIHSEKLTFSSCKDIRSLYDDVFLEEVVFEDPSNRPDGQIFRKNSVSIQSATGKVIHNGLMPETKIINAVDQSLQFLNDDSIESLFRVCLFHYLIEYIHPFYDGNGRLGRLILSYGLSNNLCPIVGFRISETIKENINEYYKAFKTCNDHRNLGDLTPFLLMQLTMVYHAMLDLKESLQKKQLEWERYEAAIENKGYEAPIRKLYSYLIQAALFSEKGISILELKENMSCSNYIIRNLMKQIDPEMIVEKKKGNFKYYSINLEKLNNMILQDDIIKLSSSQL